MLGIDLVVREYGGCVIVTLCGELDIMDTPALRRTFSAASARCPRVIADLEALEFIDCAALGVLVGARKQARIAGGDLMLATPGRRVRRILALTGLDGVFLVFGSMDEAMLATRIVAAGRVQSALHAAPARWTWQNTRMTTAIEVPPGRSLMHTLDRDAGDHRVMWDQGNDDEVQAARRTFRDLTGKGYLAYRATGKKGEQGEQIREFDPAAERIILVKPIQGG